MPLETLFNINITYFLFTSLHSFSKYDISTKHDRKLTSAAIVLKICSSYALVYISQIPLALTSASGFFLPISTI